MIPLNTLTKYQRTTIRGRWALHRGKQVIIGTSNEVQGTVSLYNARLGRCYIAPQSKVLLDENQMRAHTPEGEPVFATQYITDVPDETTGKTEQYFETEWEEILSGR